MPQYDGQIVPAWDVAFEERHRETPAPNTVTVAVSLYNYQRFIAECLDSIAASNHSNIELVVVDDASRGDDSAGAAIQWMQQHHKRFGRVSLLIHRHNQGLAEARNTGFRYARTDPVFVIDADNVIYPRALSRLHEFVAYRGYAAAFSQLEWFGDTKRLGFGDVWDKAALSSGNYIDAMAMISKRAWERVGGYTHFEGGWEDFELWCKFFEHGLPGIFVPEILCRYRVHGTSMISTDTTNSEERLKVELTARHPWLNLVTVHERANRNDVVVADPRLR